MVNKSEEEKYIKEIIDRQEEIRKIDVYYENGKLMGERDLLMKIVEQLLKIELTPKRANVFM